LSTASPRWGVRLMMTRHEGAVGQGTLAAEPQCRPGPGGRRCASRGSDLRADIARLNEGHPLRG
jgi:hypothetical protein